MRNTSWTMISIDFKTYSCNNNIWMNFFPILTNSAHMHIHTDIHIHTCTHILYIYMLVIDLVERSIQMCSYYQLPWGPFYCEDFKINGNVLLALECWSYWE